MEPTKIVPSLDMAVLQEKANEYAMKGCIESIKEYYSGYNSPFRKKIDEELKKQELSWALNLPDILGILNDSLSKEIDIIANTAISHTYIPMVKKILIRANPEVTFTDILKEFIECVEPEYSEDCEVSIENESKYGWLNIEITHKEHTYEMTFHEDSDSKKTENKKYQLLSLPRNSFNYKDKMNISFDNTKIEVPFSRDILKDKFTSYLATLVIANSKITMDTRSFDDDMFPERCHCH